MDASAVKKEEMKMSHVMKLARIRLAAMLAVASLALAGCVGGEEDLASLGGLAGGEKGLSPSAFTTNGLTTNGVKQNGLTISDR